MSVRNLTISAASAATAFILILLALFLYFQKGLEDYAGLSDSASALGASLDRLAMSLDGHYPGKVLAGEIQSTDRLFESAMKDLSSTWIPGEKDPLLASGFSRAIAGWRQARSEINGYNGGDKGLKERLISLSGEVLSLSTFIRDDTLALTRRETRALVIFSMVSIGAVWYAALFLIWRILAPIEEVTAEPGPSGRYETGENGYSELTALADRFERLFKDLNESRAHYSGLVNTIPDALAETDERGNITFVNEAVKALTGYSEKDLIGKESAGFIPQAAAGEMRDIFNAVMRGETLKNRELPVILKDGATRHFEFSSSPIRDAGGKVTGCRFVGRDIDERKKIMDELQKTREESDEASVKLKRTVEDLEEFALLAVRRELKMHDIRERFKKLLEERQG